MSFSLPAEVAPSRFLYRVDTESVEELADRFSTTPDTILGTRDILLGVDTWDSEERGELKKGEILSFPDIPPFQVEDLGEKASPEDAASKLSIPAEELRRLNPFTLSKHSGKQSRYVIPKYESFWILQKKKYVWGLQFLGAFFVPLYAATLFFLGFGGVFVLRKIVSGSKIVVQNEKRKKKKILISS